VGRGTLEVHYGVRLIELLVRLFDVTVLLQAPGHLVQRSKSFRGNVDALVKHV